MKPPLPIDITLFSRRMPRSMGIHTVLMSGTGWMSLLRTARRCSIAPLLLALCSCAALDSTAGVGNLRLDQSRTQIDGHPTQSSSSESSASHLDGSIRQIKLAHKPPAPPAEGLAVVPRAEKSVVVPAAHFTPAEPRCPADGAGPGCPLFGPPAWPTADAPCSPAAGGLVSPEEQYPDEYIYDGGDRGLPIHYSPYARQGVETEDTIAEYNDDLGRHHVEPTNRVSIYAPRFGAVRAVSSLHAGTSVARLASNFEQVRGVGMRSQVAVNSHVHNERLKGMRMRSRASGVDADARREAFDQSVKLAANTKLLNLYEDFTFLRTGQFKQTDEARLAYGIDAAFVWTRDQNPVMTITSESVQETYLATKPTELVGTDPKVGTKGRLRIVKLADKKVASPGDVITFTIRYDNLGDREVRDIRIVDNLTPRLEYIEDSETSDREGNLVLEDNGEGSHILQFELDEPLPGKTGGVITFQARVR